MEKTPCVYCWIAWYRTLPYSPMCNWCWQSFKCLGQGVSLACLGRWLESISWMSFCFNLLSSLNTLMVLVQVHSQVYTWIWAGPAGIPWLGSGQCVLACGLQELSIFKTVLWPCSWRRRSFPFLSMWHTLKDPWNIKINRKLDLQNLSAKPGITFLAAVSNRHPETCKTLTWTSLPSELSIKTTAQYLHPSLKEQIY